MIHSKLLKNLTSFRKVGSNRDGFSLIEGLVTIAIMSIAGFALMNLNVTGMKANKSNEIRVDLLDVKRTITNQLSCDQTLGSTKPTTLSGSVTLKDKNGNPLGTDGKIGEWKIEATIETLGTPSLPGLSIYATKPGKKDPVRNIPLDKTHPISALFNPDVRLCGENFKAPPSGGVRTFCPAGLVMTGFDFNTNSAICATISDLVPSCRQGEVLRKVDGNLQCAKVGLDLNDCKHIINAGGPPYYGSSASCPDGFKLISGYGSCTHNVPGKSYLHHVGSNGTSFTVDCYTEFNSESSTVAVALCCRYNL